MRVSTIGSIYNNTQNIEVDKELTIDLLKNTEGEPTVQKLFETWSEKNKDDLITINIDAAGITAQEIKDLYNFLSEKNYPYNVILKNHERVENLTIGNEEFNNLFLKNKCTHYSEKAIELLKKQRSHNVKTIKKIRPAKRNLVLGLTEKTDLQQQQQQQQSTLRSKAKKDQFSFDKHKEIDRTQIIEAELPPGLLIDKTNVNSLNAFTPGQNLNTIWSNLVGDNANAVPDGKKISYVHEEAMKKIIEHASEFAYGIVFDNLPPGFILIKNNDKLVLCYDPEREKLDYAKENRVTPLTLILTKIAEENLGTYKQFSFKSSEENIYKNHFKFLIAAVNDVDESIFKNRKIALNYFIREMAKDDHETVTQIKSLLSDSFKDFKDCHYRGLAKILLAQGPQTVLAFLNQLKYLQQRNQNLFDNFKLVFLDNQDNYDNSLIDESATQYLNELSNLTPEQQEWWISLTKQHAKAGARVDFKELYAAFSYFLKQLEVIKTENNLKGLNLTAHCPFVDIQNMKVTLDRALFIIKNAVRKEDQVNLLNGLDWGPEGAYYSAYFENYKLVTAEMMLKKTNVKYSTLETKYFREVGKEKYTYSYDVYREMLKYLDQLKIDKDLRDAIVFMLPCITTGKSILENTDEIELKDNIKNFLDIIDAGVETLLQKDVNADKKYCSLIVIAMYMINQIEQKPTLSEIKNIFLLTNEVLTQELPNEEKHKLPNEKKHISTDMFTLPITLIVKVIELYQEAAHKFIANGILRKEASEIPGSNIKALTLSKLLNTILEEDQEILNTINPRCAKDFIILLSLLEQEEKIDLKNVIELPQEAEDRKHSNIRELIIKLNVLYLSMPGVYDYTISLLKNINIYKSSKLPSVSAICTILDSIIESKELPFYTSEEEKRAKINDIIGNQFKNEVVIGNEEIAKSQLDLRKYLQNIFVLMDIKNQIKRLLEDKLIQKVLTIQPNLKSLIKESVDILTKCEAQINDENATLEQIFSSAMEGNICLKAIMAELPENQFFKFQTSATDTIFNVILKREPTPDELAEFIKNPSLLVFVKASIIKDFTREIMSKASQLNLSEEVLTYLTNKLGEFNMKGQIAEELKIYNDKYTKIIKLLNTLIEIKNNDKNDIKFKNLINILLETDQKNLKSLEPELHDQIWNLLITNQNIPFISNLKLIYQSIDNNKTKSAQFPAAIDELANLIKIYDSFTPNVFENILTISFEFNLKNPGNLFPLKSLTELEKIAVPENQGSKILLDKIIAILANATPNVIENLIPKLINSTINEIKDLTHINETMPFLSLLLDLIKTAKESEINVYLNLLESLTDDFSTAFKIISGACLDTSNHVITKNNRPIITIDQVKDLLAKLTSLTKEELLKISDLYMYQPFPTLEVLKEIINTIEIPKREELIKNADLDPLKVRLTGEPRKEQISLQFSTKRAKAVTQDIKDMLEGVGLSKDEQHALIQQFSYVNGIGYREGFKPGPLTEMSREQLNKLFKDISIKVNNPSKEIAETAQLQLLAVLREIMFRTTGKVPHSTQILVALLSLNYPEDLLLQINTGEGKSITNALLAVLQQIKGHTIVINTENSDLAIEGYDEFHDFFKFLEIPFAHITSSSPIGVHPNGAFCQGGINITTPGDMSLYRSAADLEGIDLAGEKPMSVFLDEADAAVLDNRNVLNLTDSNSVNESYEWVFQHINNFIAQDEFLDDNPDSKTSWDSNEDIARLKQHLSSKAVGIGLGAIKQVNQLSKDQLDRWIDSACRAKGYKEREQFKVEVELRDGKEVKVIVPYNETGVPQPGSSFKDGVQELLQARFGYPIDKPMVVVASESVKTYMEYYPKKSGRMIFITATAGILSELKYQKSKFGMRIFGIPPHNKNNRKLDETIVVKNGKSHLRAIESAIQSAYFKETHNAQPALSFTGNAARAHVLFEKLTGLTKEAQGLIQQLANNGEYKNSKANRLIFKQLLHKVLKDLPPHQHQFIKALANGKYKATEESTQFFATLQRCSASLSSAELTGISYEVRRLFEQLADGKYEHSSEAVNILKTFRDNKKIFKTLPKQIQLHIHAVISNETVFDENGHLIPEAQKSFKELRDGKYIGREFNYQLITGEETPAQRKMMKVTAGKVNTVTITTKLMARGANIPALHPKGLFVIDTDLDIERESTQKEGRSARNGQEGRYVGIYDQNDFSEALGGIDLSSLSGPMLEKELKKVKTKKNLEASVSRYYIQQVDGIKNVALKHFNRWYKTFIDMKLKDASIKEETEKYLLSIKDNLLKEIEAKWETILKDSDPENLYRNPYIRYVNKKLDHQSLDRCLQTLEREVALIWQNTKTLIKHDVHLENALKNVMGYEADLFNQRISYLTDLKIEPDIEKRKLEYHQKKREERKEHKLSSRTIDYALDEDAAYLAFSSELTSDEKQKLVINSCYHQLSFLKQDLSDVISKLEISKMDKRILSNKLKEISALLASERSAEFLQNMVNELIQFVDLYLEKCTHLKDQYQLQPYIVHIFEFIEQVQKYNIEGQEAKININDIKLNNIKDYFVNNSIDSVIKDLETSLAWVNNKKWDYKIERDVVCQSAEKILAAIGNYQKANQENKENALIELYQQLELQKIKLDDVWIVGLGHPNTLNVINNALNLLEQSAKISKKAQVIEGVEQSLIDHKKIHAQGHESAILEYYLPVFKADSRRSTAKWTKKHAQKINVCKAINEVSDEIAILTYKSNSIHVFYQVYHALKAHADTYLVKAKELDAEIKECKDKNKRKNLTIQKHENQLIIEYINEQIKCVQANSIDMENKYKNKLLTVDHFIETKGPELLKHLEDLFDLVKRKEGWSAKFKNLSLHTGHTGFKETYELRLEPLVDENNYFVTNLGFSKAISSGALVDVKEKITQPNQEKEKLILEMTTIVELENIFSNHTGNPFKFKDYSAELHKEIHGDFKLLVEACEIIKSKENIRIKNMNLPLYLQNLIHKMLDIKNCKPKDIVLLEQNMIDLLGEYQSKLYDINTEIESQRRILDSLTKKTDHPNQLSSLEANKSLNTTTTKEDKKENEGSRWSRFKRKTIESVKNIVESPEQKAANISNEISKLESAKSELLKELEITIYNKLLPDILSTELHKKEIDIQNKINEVKLQLEDKINAKDKEIKFLEKKSASAKKKTEKTVLFKQFNTIDELLDFERSLGEKVKELQVLPENQLFAEPNHLLPEGNVGLLDLVVPEEPHFEPPQLSKEP